MKLPPSIREGSSFESFFWASFEALTSQLPLTVSVTKQKLVRIGFFMRLLLLRYVVGWVNESSRN